MNENVAVAPPFRYCWTHFWSTSWSSNYIYYMSFQILGCQESNALNGARFGVETNKLCLFEDKREKLKREFCSRDTIWKGVSQLRHHPLAHECHFAAPVRPFRSCKMGCKNPPPLRNSYFAVKWSPSFEMATKSPPSVEMAFKLRNWLAKWREVCKNTLQSQGKLLKCHQSPATMWFMPNWCLSWFVFSWCSLIKEVINKIYTYNTIH